MLYVSGGVEILCDNLVLSNQRVINMSPSLVSTLMQYLGNVRMGSPLHKKTTADSDNLEDLQNFAPVGRYWNNRSLKKSFLHTVKMRIVDILHYGRWRPGARYVVLLV